MYMYLYQVYVILWFSNSSFSDYNKEQFTPVKLEGAAEQVSEDAIKKALGGQCKTATGI